MFKSFQKYPLETCLKVFRNFLKFPKLSLKEYVWKIFKILKIFQKHLWNNMLGSFFKFLEKSMKNKFKRCKTNKFL